jgi:drug/metabolite transporter (DMT)-like permease
VSTIISCFHPIAGMLFAYWILAEVPTMQQIFGSMILLLGLLFSQVKYDRNQETSEPFEMRPANGGINGFKGL